MNFDVRNDRHDAAILEALRWQAEQAPDLAPSFDQAIREVARRLSGDVARRGDARRTLVILAAALMLVTLLIGTLAIGAGLIRLPWMTEEPPAFGFAGACRTTLGEGLLLEVSTEDSPRLALHDDGTLVSVDAATDEALTFHSFSATITERRMTEQGIQLLLGAVTDTGLTSGCRDLYGPEEVQFRAATPAGPVVVSVGTFPGAYGAGPNMIRVLDPADEARIHELVDRLADPAAWLPADAWADAPRNVVPEAWEVAVGWHDSGQGPGDVVSFPSGKVLRGSNPDFASIRLPNGERIDGDACLVASTSETQALADILDEVGHVQDLAWYVFSEDLTREYTITASAIVPGAEPCAGTQSAPPGASETPDPARQPTDACDLLDAAGAEAVLGGPIEFLVRPPITFIGTETPVCTIQAKARSSAYRRVIAAVLRPDLSADDAASVAAGILGADLTEEPLADGARLWLSACWSRACPPSLVAWSGGRLFLLSFDRDYINGTSYVSLAEARALAAAIAAAVVLK